MLASHQTKPTGAGWGGGGGPLIQRLGLAATRRLGGVRFWRRRLIAAVGEKAGDSTAAQTPPCEVLWPIAWASVSFRRWPEIEPSLSGEVIPSLAENETVEKSSKTSRSVGIGIRSGDGRWWRVGGPGSSIGHGWPPGMGCICEKADIGSVVTDEWGDGCGGKWPCQGLSGKSRRRVWQRGFSDKLLLKPWAIAD